MANYKRNEKNPHAQVCGLQLKLYDKLSLLLSYFQFEIRGKKKKKIEK